MNADWVNALLGGTLIGISVSLMLLLNGRVTGISGIVNGVLFPSQGEVSWRVLFIGGLLVGGLTMFMIAPDQMANTLIRPSWAPIVAGLLVGFGTIMGSGCTSGHGVCGISRLSPRSLVATVVFMAAGIATVVALRQMGVSV